jgi:iron complex transport system substrate-binding protein
MRRTQQLRIVSLLPSATEIVSAIGLSECLVGVTHECDHPPGISSLPHLTASKINHESMSSREIDHAVRAQLDGHGSIYDLDESALARLAPDLILTQELCEVCAVSYKTVASAARACAADAEIVSLEPNTIEDIFSNILTVGSLTGLPNGAEELVNKLRTRIGDLGRRSAEIEGKPRVMMLEWLDPPFSPGHWVPEQAEAAGGVCVLGSAGEKSVTTTYPASVESNADVMVFIPCGYGIADILRQLGSTVFPESLREMKAVRDGNLWAVNASAYFSRPGPRVVEGAEILAKVLHPAEFGTPEPFEAVKIDPSTINFAGSAAG